MASIYSKLGKAMFITFLPCLRLYLKHSERAYIIIEHEGSVLMVKNWMSEQDWRLPGGGKNVHESWALAGMREVHEELGIMIEQQKLEVVSSGIWQTNALNFSYKIMHIKCAQKPKFKRAYFELIAVKWMEPKQILNETSSEIAQAFVAAGLT